MDPESVVRKSRAVFRKIAFTLLVALLFPLTLWAFGAVYFDGPFPGTINLILALLWIGALVAGLVRFHSPTRKFLVWLCLFLTVVIPWSLKKPSNERDWSPEFANAPQATLRGDTVTFTHFRNFDYRPDNTPIERWETREFHLSKLRHMDFFMTYWGTGKLIGHPVFSFDFGDEGHVAFSIESRREKGETYGLLSGLYKQFELVYIVGSESDIVRSRTNFRTDENVYLYRLKIKETTTRLRFAEYLDSINRFHDKPAWYNAVTANCTTSVRGQITTAERFSFDWRILANGRLDELLNERHCFDESISFAELKRRSHINPTAHRFPDPAGFSEKIREGVPGF